MGEVTTHERLSKGKSSIIFGMVGIISFLLSMLLTEFLNLPIALLYWGLPMVCGITAVVIGIIGVRKDEKKVLAFVGVLLGLHSMYSYPLFYLIATSFKIYA